MIPFDIVLLVAGALFLLGWTSWYLLAAPRSQWLCPAVFSGRRDRKEIALTFDDGPGIDTPRILDILREKGVLATFFLCGANVEKFPELARRIVAEGHAIGSHAYSHQHFLGKSRDWMRGNLEKAAGAITEHLGRQGEPAVLASRLFRPPYGIRWFGLAGVLQNLQLKAVMWDVNSEDWKRPAEGIVSKVIRETGPGSIILLHDGIPPQERGTRENTVIALPKIIAQLSDSYRFVTIPQLLDSKD